MKPKDLKIEFDRKQAETKGYCSALHWMAEKLEQEERENLRVKKSAAVSTAKETAPTPK